MIEEEYITQLQRKYTTYLQRVVMGEAFLPLALIGGKKRPETTRELHERIQLFQKKEKTAAQKGWNIEWVDWVSRKLGKQQWPGKITVPTEEDYLYLINKEEEVAVFKEQLQQMLLWNKDILHWVLVKPQRVLELIEVWRDISAVVDYLVQNEVGHYYVRSLPVPVHTKFIEKNEATLLSILHHLAPHRFRELNKNFSKALGLLCGPSFFIIHWLDQALADKYTYGMRALAVTIEGLKMLNWEIEAICVVENKTNLYLLPETKGMLVVEGQGKASSLLKEIPLFERTKLFYWGDLDEEGFLMLNRFRKNYVHVQSLMMDEATVRFHQAEMHDHPPVYGDKDLSLLIPSERDAYDILAKANGWIEQERMQQQYIQQALEIALKRQ